MFNGYCGTFKGEGCLGCDSEQALLSTAKVDYICASDEDKFSSSSSSNGSCKSFYSCSIVTQKKIAQNSHSLLY